MKQIKINVPEGHEIDTERSDLSTGEIYFREKKPEFKVGDWVVGWHCSYPNVDHFNYQAWKINAFEKIGGEICAEPEIHKGFGTDVLNIRHATPSEIAEAKKSLREKELPKRWEDLFKDSEFKGYYVDEYSEAESIEYHDSDDWDMYRNTFPTSEEAEASIALAQLCQIRDAYNGCKYSELKGHELFYAFTSDHFELSILGFKTDELRSKFDSEPEIQKLIEKAKPLL